jgi:ATP-dependent Lon protease
MKGNRIIGTVGSKRPADDNPQPGEIYETGTVVRVLYVTRSPDNTVLLVVQGLKRFLVTDWIPGKDFFKAKIQLIPEIRDSDIETKALHRSLRDLTQEIFA